MGSPKGRVGKCHPPSLPDQQRVWLFGNRQRREVQAAGSVLCVPLLVFLLALLVLFSPGLTNDLLIFF